MEVVTTPKTSECQAYSENHSTTTPTSFLGFCIQIQVAVTAFGCAVFWAAVLLPVLMMTAFWLYVCCTPVLVPLVALGLLQGTSTRSSKEAQALTMAAKASCPPGKMKERTTRRQPPTFTTLSAGAVTQSDTQLQPEAEPTQVAATPDTGIKVDPAASLPWSFGICCVQNARNYMEDRVAVVDLSHHDAFKLAGYERAVLVAVFDGHGGAAAAEYLAATISSKLLQEQAATMKQQPLAALTNALEELEKDLLSAYKAANGPASGSTACVALLLDNTVHVANVGDSRAVLARGPKALALTTDHKPLCEAERKRIALADSSAVVTDDGYLYGELAVSRGLGSAHIKRDVSKAAYVATCDAASFVLGDSDDFLIVASDGLWDKVGSSDATSAARRSLAADADPTAAAQVLADRAQKLGSTDNISVVVMVPHGRTIVMPKSNSRLFSRKALPAAVPPAGVEGSA